MTYNDKFNDMIYIEFIILGFLDKVSNLRLITF